MKWSVCRVIMEHSKDSKTFGMPDIMDIGRKFVILSSSPFLYTGIIIAFFHAEGNKPVVNDLLKIMLNGEASADSVNLKNTGGISPEPAPL